MSRFFALLLIGVCVVLSMSSLAHAGVPVPVNPVLTTLLTKELSLYSNMWQSRNFSGLVEELYTSDCQFMPGGSNLTIQYGHNQTLNVIEQVLSNGIATLNFTNIETGADNQKPDLIYQIGVYNMYDINGQIKDQGKHVFLWEKQDDNSWKIYVHIFNSNINW